MNDFVSDQVNIYIHMCIYVRFVLNDVGNVGNSQLCWLNVDL